MNPKLHLPGCVGCTAAFNCQNSVSRIYILQTIYLACSPVFILLMCLINNTHETREWLKDLCDVTMIVLKKKPKATKCSDHRTVSLIAHTANIVAGIHRRRSERKVEDVLKDQFGFRRGKGAIEAIGVLRIIPERTLEIDEEWCVISIDWQNASDRVKWVALVQILRENGIDWCERRFISKFYMDQCVKVRLDQGETTRVKTGLGARQGCICHRLY